MQSFSAGLAAMIVLALLSGAMFERVNQPSVMQSVALKSVHLGNH